MAIDQRVAMRFMDRREEILKVLERQRQILNELARLCAQLATEFEAAKTQPSEN